MDTTVCDVEDPLTVPEDATMKVDVIVQTCPAATAIFPQLVPDVYNWSKATPDPPPDKTPFI